jgi:two-component system phosphate regulon sensor histidine kinase PhoR
MRRSLFLACFLRMALALLPMAIVVAILTAHWLGAEMASLGLVGVLALLAVMAFGMAQFVRRSLFPLQTLAEKIPDRIPALDGLELQRFSDFDGLAGAIAGAATKTLGALTIVSESRHELEALLDSMQDAVVAVDAAGRIQWANQAMQRLMPGAAAASSVRVGHALVQTARDPELLACVRTALEERAVCERRTTSLVPGRIFEVNASPMPAGGAVAVLHDITRIEEVERTQRDFVANVSHELRTPLTSISGYVETLLDHEESLSPVAREFLATILKNATRMSRLTEDLLTMARVESREAVLHPKSVRADVLVHDAVSAMRGLVQDAEAELEIGDTTGAEVFVDTDSMVQVLGNLIENGIKYGQAKEAARSRVVVSAREVWTLHDGEQGADGLGLPGAGVVEFSVLDFGPGIASEHLTRIFERFYRVDKARSRESGGTGLGLAIARHMVEMQGGSIRAESELGVGSNFLVRLPMAWPMSE